MKHLPDNSPELGQLRGFYEPTLRNIPLIIGMFLLAGAIFAWFGMPGFVFALIMSLMGSLPRIWFGFGLRVLIAEHGLIVMRFGRVRPILWSQIASIRYRPESNLMAEQVIRFKLHDGRRITFSGDVDNNIPWPSMREFSQFHLGALIERIKYKTIPLILARAEEQCLRGEKFRLSRRLAVSQGGIHLRRRTINWHDAHQIIAYNEYLVIGQKQGWRFILLDNLPSMTVLVALCEKFSGKSIPTVIGKTTDPSLQSMHWALFFYEASRLVGFIFCLAGPLLLPIILF